MGVGQSGKGAASCRRMSPWPSVCPVAAVVQIKASTLHEKALKPNIDLLLRRS